MRAMIREQI